MPIPSRSLPRLLTGLAGVALAIPAQAQVTITCDQTQITSRVPCVLTAAHGDGKPRTWTWSVVGLEDPGQLLEAAAPDRVRVRTPVTLTERSFTVVAEESGNPSVTGTFVLRITPNPRAGSSERALAEGIFPNAFTPSLVPFKGHPERIERWRGQVWAHQLAFCDDEAMGALDRCWLLARDTGLEAFKLAGDPVAIPGFPDPEPRGLRCVAVAALPPGPGEVPAGAPRVVFCEHEQSPSGVNTGSWRIHALDAGGRRRLLACSQALATLQAPDETAPRIATGTVSGLALDRRGNVYIGSYWGEFWKLGLDGRVGSFWAGPPSRLALSPTCFAVDPATEDVYVGDRWRLVQCSPEGKLTRVIGDEGQSPAPSRSSEPARLSSGRVPPDTRFDLGLRQVAIHGRELILAGEYGIYAFHLDSRRLALLLPVDEALQENRLGPVPYLNPRLPADRCAAIRSCRALALTREAMGIMALGQGLAELELPDGPITTVMDPPDDPSAPGLPAGDAGPAEREDPPRSRSASRW